MPRIYVACLAAYNSGILHGVWIDADEEPDTIFEAIHAMLADSPIVGAEEFAIHDYDGFGNYDVGEYSPIEEVSLAAQFIAGSDDEELAGVLLGSYSVAEAETLLSESYTGCYESLEAFAEEITDTDGVPEELLDYIDFAAKGRDLLAGGAIFTEQTKSGLHIFWNQ